MYTLDTDRPFRTWLKEQRKLSGFTQQKLAQYLNCTVSLIQKLESGARTPSLLIARKIAQIFEIDSAEYPLFITWSVQAPETPTPISPQVPYPKAESLIMSPRLFLANALVGRHNELMWIESFFQERQGRLLSIVGPAGVGKTSLALVVGSKLQHVYKTIKIDLDRVEHSDLVLMTISQQLGLGGTSEHVIQAAFQHIIGDETLLLIIDTFEHVLDAAGVIQAILSWCPNIRILITSQAPLHLYEERVYQLEPLELPHEHTATLQELEHSQAGSLLLERLREQRPNWKIADSEAQMLAQICRAVDGLPLATELLAVRLRWITPQRLWEYLEHDYSMAQRATSAMPERHQSLEYAIQRSYELLPEQAQVLFCRLSIFADGWSLDEAYLLYANAYPQSPTQGSFIALIELLLERGLILPFPTNSERFRMLRALRLFGQRIYASESSDSYAQAYQQQSDYYIQKLEQLNMDSQNALWHQSMHELLANCMQSLQWNIDQGFGDSAAQIAINYAPFWYRTQAWREAHYWFERINRLPIEDQKLAVDSARWYANTCYLMQDYETAVTVVFTILKRCEQEQNWKAMTAALNSLSVISMGMGHYLEARRYLHSAYTLAQQHDLEALIPIYNNLGRLGENEGLYHEAIEMYRKQYQIVQNTPHDWIKCQCWLNLGQAYLASNQEHLALWAVDQAAAINQTLQSIAFVQDILRIQIYIALDDQQSAKALTLAQQLFETLAESEDHKTILMSMIACTSVLEAFDAWELVAPIVVAFDYWINLGLVVLGAFERERLALLKNYMHDTLPPETYAMYAQQGRLLTKDLVLNLLASRLTS